jgi:UDP-N-acetylglucosamine transferase subunit ALG13
MARVLVTVGMGPWPFDRLIEAITPLCAEHEVFAQTGTSSLRPPCPHAAFVPFGELDALIAAVDIIITHAGNTVRLVQRAQKVPIAVARQAALGEMANDHQVEYLRFEERTGPVQAVWDVRELPRAVLSHDAEQIRLLRERPVLPPASPDHIIETLDSLCARVCRGGRGR